METVSNISDRLCLKITVKDAAKYSYFTAKELLRHAAKHYIPVLKGNVPVDFSNEQIDELSASTWIPLSELPPECAQRWLIENIAKEGYVSIDFLAYQALYGKEAVSVLISTLAQLRLIEQRLHDNAVIKNILTAAGYLETLGIAKTSYFAGKKQLKDFNRHISQLCGLGKQTRFNTLCPLARDFLTSRALDYNAADTETIFADLQTEQAAQGIDICSECPHNTAAQQYREAVEYVNEHHPECNVPQCITPGNGMIIPTEVTTVYRYIRAIPETVSYFAKADKKAFAAKYMFKVSRNPESTVNRIAFLDHVELDIMLVFGYDKDNNPILRKPWATVMTDAASVAIIGSVLSFFPNKITIGQCFARAVTVKPNSIIMGTPLVLMADRGRDFKSSYIASNDKELQKLNSCNNFANREFFNNGLLDVLGTKMVHLPPHHPWAKNVERTNREINKLIHRVPGYVGGKKLNCFKEKRQKELNRLMAENRLLTMVDFAEKYWYSHIVPTYNNHSYRGELSPMDKYRTLPHAQTVVPDFNTLSVYLHEKQSCYVYPDGILYNNQYYYHPALAEFIVSRGGAKDPSRKVQIYTLDANYDDSIFVVYSNKATGDNRFICEAFKKDCINMLDENKWRLRKAIVYKHLQKRYLSDTIEIVQYLTETSHINLRHYLNETFSDPAVTIGERVDRTTAYPVMTLSSEAVKANIAEHEAIIRYLSENSPQ